MKTRVTEMLGIEKPIIQAAMGWIARSQLSSAVSNAGGMGIIETSSGELDAVRAEIVRMRALTDKPFGVNVAQAFVRDPSIVQFVIDQGVRFVTTSAGDPMKYTAMLKDAGLTVFHVVPNLAGALRAVEAGVDGLIVEGGEGGGFKNAKDVKKLERIFNDLFVKGMSVKDVGEKYFHVMDLDWVDQIQDDDTIISYSRMAAWRMRKEMREGMNVRCQDHTGNSNIHINDMFILAEIGEMCTLMNIADDSVECVTKHALFRFFEPEGAVTCHSVQGTTIQGRIVVAEFDSPWPTTHAGSGRD